MTGQELLTYQMNREEQIMWYRFCVDIKNKLEALKLEPYAYEVLLKKLTKGTPYTYMGGYSQTDGYYYVVAGDRGACNLLFKTKSYGEVWDKMLKELARDIAYDCIFKDKERLEAENRHLWRYYYVYVGREANRKIYQTKENETWIYDDTYDYRKYWFELAIYILKGTVSEHMLCEEIKRYEKLLNSNYFEPYWSYDVGKTEFVGK